jgi:hypothetical protein
VGPKAGVEHVPIQSRELEPFEMFGTTCTALTQYHTPDEWLPQTQDIEDLALHCT